MIEPKNILLLLILIISTLQIHAQEPIQRVEYSVHFESDQYHLTKNEAELLHSFVDSLQQYDVKRIYLTGHTDSDADSLYNVELSKNRTTEIKKLLSIRGIDSNVLRMTYHGEAKPVAANSDEKSKALNRRVHLRVLYTLRKVSLEKKENELDQTPKDTCQGDTTIALPQGTLLTLNTCEFLKKKDCVNFEEILTPSAVQRRNVNTVDNRENPLVSFGMFAIDARPGCQKTCLTAPLTVNIPFPKSNCYRGTPSLFDLNTRNSWSRTRGNNGQVRVVTINGARYFQFTIANPCSNTMKNLDCKVERPPKVTFRVNRNFTIDSIVLYDSCPFYNYTLTPGKNKSAHKIKKEMPCFVGDGYMKVTLSDKNGKRLLISAQRPYELAKRRIFSRCGKRKDEPRVKNEKGLLKFRERPLYRRYKIKKYQIESART